VGVSDYVVGKNPCKRCRARGNDHNGDNFHFYGEGLGGHCFVCNYTLPSDDWLAEHGEVKEEEYEEVSTREAITPEENEKIKSYTGTDGKGFRGIRKEINSFFGVRYSYDETTGEPIKEFVPTTINGELVGYRTRVFPKDFTQPIGKVGKECDLVGQFRFKNGGNTIIIAGGEIKQRAAYQMLLDEQKAKGKTEWEPTAVVSPTIGESGAYKQIQAQYDFFLKWKKIIVMMDADDAGRDAAQKIVKVLPRGRVFIMETRYKDADEYIKLGKEKEFIQDFWKAKAYTPAGLHSSAEMYSAALDYVKLERLPMPPFLRKVEEMLGGGIPRGYLCMWAAGTSSGKSTVINQALTWWVMNTKEVIGVLSLEATLGELSTNLLSSYTKTKFAAIRDPEEREKLLKTDYVQQAAQELFTKEDGSPRFYVCDDRGSTRKEVEAKVEQMIAEMGITVLVVDVLSDILSGLSISEQEEHMAWQKSIIKAYGVTIHNIVHIRKAATSGDSASLGAEITEDQLFGTSSIAKSAGVTIALVRNKMAEDADERNTIKVRLLKNRSMGLTGAAGEIYYDPDTTVLQDKQEWLQNNPQEF
jgi:archaellum biogenesis ATPase FlaH